MTKQSQGGHSGGKKVFANFLLLISLPVLIIGVHWYIFKTFDTPYERNVRTFIANSLQFFLTYQEDSPSPHAVQQTFMVHDDLIAFSDKLVYTQEEIVTLRFRSRLPLTISVMRVSNQGSEKLLTQNLSPSHFVGGAPFNTFTGFHGADFDEFRFPLGESESGWMQIEVRNPMEHRNIPIFVEGHKSADVLFVESTDTMKAYISANQMRTYYKPGFLELLGTFTRPEGYPMNYKLIPFHHTTTRQKISCNDHLANADFVLKNHLQQSGLVFDVASDEFLEHEQNLFPYKLLILGAHNEYWSAVKFQNIERFVLRGGESFGFWGKHRISVGEKS